MRNADGSVKGSVFSSGEEGHNQQYGDADKLFAVFHSLLQIECKNNHNPNTGGVFYRKYICMFLGKECRMQIRLLAFKQF